MKKIEIANRINEVKRYKGLKEEDVERLIKNTKEFLSGKLESLETLGEHKWEVSIGNKSGDGMFFGVEGTAGRLMEIIEQKKTEVRKLYYCDPIVEVKIVDEIGKHIVLFK